MTSMYDAVMEYYYDGCSIFDLICMSDQLTDEEAEELRKMVQQRYPDGGKAIFEPMPNPFES